MNKNKTNTLSTLKSLSTNENSNISNLSNKYFEEEYKSQIELLIELLEGFNIIIPHPKYSSKMKELKESNEEYK